MQSSKDGPAILRRRTVCAYPSPDYDRQSTRSTLTPHLSVRRGLALANLFAVSLLVACAYNPTIGREQIILVSDAELVSMAAASWSAVDAETPVSRDNVQIARVNKVGARLLNAMGEVRSDWEFRVFEDQTLNAFALPGGKVGLHSAMVAFCQTDDELASVIGHEIAHVKLRHAAERMSQQLATQGVVNAIVSDESDIAALLGARASLGVILPFSRKHELEADRLGLQYVKMANYDPMSAVALWTRMSEQAGRGQGLAFLSTHPSDKQRIDAIRTEASRLNATPS